MLSVMPQATAHGTRSGDMHLHVALKAAGKAKGEARAEGHEDDIEVLAWRWGASAVTAVGTSAGTARRAYKHLTVVKALDSASTVLLTALKSNDEVSEARLTMRKTGGDPQGYFDLVLGGARVASIDYSADESGVVSEVLTLSFASVKLEYRPQQEGGLLGPSHVFDDKV